MAEENNNTLSFLDPTEPLGPITGSTNLPSTDPVNMQPFEGDKFSVPEINFPTAVYNRQYAVDPTIETKENVVGKPGEPAKTKNLNAKINIKDIAEAYMNKTLATGRSIAQNAMLILNLIHMMQLHMLIRFMIDTMVMVKKLLIK